MKWLLLLLLTGCTMYSVEKVAPDGSSTIVKVNSMRSFETPNLHYAREGNDAIFDFSAAGVDNNSNAIWQMFMQGILSGAIKAN